MSITKRRIAALRRMLDEHWVGLDTNTTKDDYARIIDELLDEVEFLKVIKPDPAGYELA